jgi:hypothetical protein
MKKKNYSLAASVIIACAAWLVLHVAIHILTKNIGDPAFSYAAPYLFDILVMLFALMLTRKQTLLVAEAALFDILLFWILMLLGLSFDYQMLYLQGKEEIAKTLAITGIFTGLMANAKYFGRKYFEKRLNIKKKK